MTETVAAGMCASALFCSQNAKHVPAMARKATAAHAPTETVPKAGAGSVATAPPSENRKAPPVCTADMAAGPISERPRSESTMPSANKAEEPRPTNSPMPNDSAPPLQHRRYRPASTAICRTNVLKRYVRRISASAITGVNNIGREMKKPALVALVISTASELATNATAYTTPTGSHALTREPRRPLTICLPNRAMNRAKARPKRRVWHHSGEISP